MLFSAIYQHLLVVFLRDFFVVICVSIGDELALIYESACLRHLTHMPHFVFLLRSQEIQEIQQTKGSRAGDAVALDHFWADAKRLTISNNSRDVLWSKRKLFLTQERVSPSPPTDFWNLAVSQYAQEVQFVIQRYGRLKLAVKDIPAPGVCLDQAC